MPANAKELLDRLRMPTDRTRRARERALVHAGNLAGIVAARITGVQFDHEIAKRMRRHMSTQCNLATDVTAFKAVVYKQGVSRLLTPKRFKIAEKAPKITDLPLLQTDRAQEALDQIARETRMARLAPEIDRLTAYVGPVLEVPSITATGEIRRRLFTADRFDVQVDPDDPLGLPIAAAVVCFDPSTDGRRRGGPGACVVVIDEERRRWYMPDSDQLYREQEHSVKIGGRPVLPATCWRDDEPTDEEDWFRAHAHEGLHEATIEICRILTTLSWVRKSQDKNLITVIGNSESLPEGQILDPERPLVIDVRGGEDAPQVQVHPMDLDPKNALAHVMWLYRQQFAAAGIPQSLVDFDGAQRSSRDGEHEQLAALRNQRKPFFRDAERASTSIAVAVAKAGGWHMAERLPDPEDVQQRFYLDVPELNRVDDPKIQREIFDWDISKGLMNLIDLVRQRNPDMTDREAAIELVRNRETQAAINDFDASRNQTSKPDGGAVTAAQANGAMGPVVRDAPPQPQEQE